jgi:hypothetical protein
MGQEERNAEIPLPESERAAPGETPDERFAEVEGLRRCEMPAPCSEHVTWERVNPEHSRSGMTSEHPEQIAIGRNPDRRLHVALEHVSQRGHPPHLRRFHWVAIA